MYFISKNAAEPVQISKPKTVQKLMVTKKNTLIEAISKATWSDYK